MSAAIEGQQQLPEHFMTPRFYGAALAAGGVALAANLEELGGLSAYIQERFGFGLAVAVHKRTIEDRGRTVFELQTHDLSAPLSLAVARAIVAQPPDKAGFATGTSAWGDYAKRRFTWSGLADSVINAFAPSSQTTYQRLAREAAQRFPRAVVLERRQITD